MTSIRIDIACNDPDNGLFAGRAEMIILPDDLMSLECLGRVAPRLVELDRGIRLAGKHWPVTGSKEWIGNWCWNGYFMEAPVAVAFMVWLHGRKLFSVDSAEERLFNIWKAARSWDWYDRALVERLLSKAALHQREAA